MCVRPVLRALRLFLSLSLSVSVCECVCVCVCVCARAEANLSSIIAQRELQQAKTNCQIPTINTTEAYNETNSDSKHVVHGQ